MTAIVCTGHRPGNDEIQLDLFGDYKSNVASLLEKPSHAEHRV